MLDGQNILSCISGCACGIEENQPAIALDPASVSDREQAMRTEEVVAENVIFAAFGETGEWRERKTILLVEDEAFVRRVTAEVLDAAGYHLLIARNASDAFDVVRGNSGNIDLLLVDIVMPGMSGRELAADLGRRHPCARALLMSGYAEQFAQTDQGCPEAYLAKPFSARTLLETVRRLLDQDAVACPAVA